MTDPRRQASEIVRRDAATDESADVLPKQVPGCALAAGAPPSRANEGSRPAGGRVVLGRGHVGRIGWAVLAVPMISSHMARRRSQNRRPRTRC